MEIDIMYLSRRLLRVNNEIFNVRQFYILNKAVAALKIKRWVYKVNLIKERKKIGINIREYPIRIQGMSNVDRKLMYFFYVCLSIHR